MRRINSFREEEEKFIRENYKGMLSSELTEKLNEKFGTSYKEKKVRDFKHSRGLNSGVSTRFSPDKPSFNKGKHLYVGGRSVETQFKPGQVPYNIKPVGTISKRDYWYIKVDDTPKQHKNWVPYHKYIWEKTHGQKIPKGYVVMFLDKNIDNLDPDNLILVNKRVHSIINKYLILTKDAEINRSIITLAELKLKMNDLKRDKDETTSNL